MLSLYVILPVRNHDGRALLHDVVECFLNDALALLVEGTCSLVKHQHLRLADDGTSNSHSLLLPPGEFTSSKTAFDVEATIQGTYVAIR